ncbi:MAG TPA: hypothetical protein VMB05_04985 [Solirubrobacteraceae bacterium]|nr:hypothetical protein [Solirubrobacteraceae bacterium]
MPVNIPITITLSDEAIATIVAALAPTTAPDAVSTTAEVGHIELPQSWKHVEDWADQTYPWPNREEPDVYDPFSVFEGKTSAGSIKIAIGRCEREPVWAAERPYMITFFITPGGAKRPLCEFLRDDEGGYVSVIKGKGENARSLYSEGDDLPPEYAALSTAMYPDRVHAKGVWKKKVVVADGEEDVETMLNHSLIQAVLRYGIAPA